MLIIIRTGFYIFFVLLLFFFSNQALAAEELPIKAKAVVLMDNCNSQILYQKNMYQRMFPASTTKILTAIVALENGKLDEVVSVPFEACRVKGSAIGLQEGEKLTLEDLLYALMLASANDAAEAIAIHIAGSVSGFSALMNKKASEIGVRNSNFVNPHGLPDPDHYTTAYDLAMITRYAMQNPFFREIVQTSTKVISRSTADRSKGPPQENLWNHNKLLKRYNGAIGVKTGYTVAAGKCLVAAAKKNDRELIAVVLKSQGSEVYEDAKKLLDYGFDHFTQVLLLREGDKVITINVKNGKPKKVDLVTASNFYYVIPKGKYLNITNNIHLNQNIEAPIAIGQRVGELVLYDRKKNIGKVDLTAGCSVRKVSGRSWRLWVGGLTVLVFIVTRSILRKSRIRYRPRRLRNK